MRLLMRFLTNWEWLMGLDDDDDDDDGSATPEQLSEQESESSHESEVRKSFKELQQDAQALPETAIDEMLGLVGRRIARERALGERKKQKEDEAKVIAKSSNLPKPVTLNDHNLIREALEAKIAETLIAKNYENIANEKLVVVPSEPHRLNTFSGVLRPSHNLFGKISRVEPLNGISVFHWATIAFLGKLNKTNQIFD